MILQSSKKTTRGKLLRTKEPLQRLTEFKPIMRTETSLVIYGALKTENVSASIRKFKFRVATLTLLCCRDALKLGIKVLPDMKILEKATLQKIKYAVSGGLWPSGGGVGPQDQFPFNYGAHWVISRPVIASQAGLPHKLAGKENMGRNAAPLVDMQTWQVGRGIH